MSEYVVFSEELLRNFYNPATCSYMVPLSGKAAHDMKILRDENATLKAENTKLRVLVRDMWSYDYARNFSTLDSDVEHRESVWQRMSELGIEVDE